MEVKAFGIEVRLFGVDGGGGGDESKSIWHRSATIWCRHDKTDQR